MASNEGKDKVCLKSIAPRLMEVMREMGTTTSENLAAILINKLVCENQNANSQDTVKRRIYDVINVLSAAGIIEKVGKKLTWKGMKSFGSAPSQQASSSAQVSGALMPPLPAPTVTGIPNDLHIQIPPSSSVPQQAPNQPLRLISPLSGLVPSQPQHNKILTLAEKERQLYYKIKVLTLYKLLLRRNTMMDRPQDAIPIRAIIFGFKSPKQNVIRKESKEKFIIETAPDFVETAKSILFMKFDKENLRLMLSKNPNYKPFTEQVLDAKEDDVPFFGN